MRFFTPMVPFFLPLNGEAKVPCSCGRGVGLDEEPYATLALMLRHIRGRGSGGRNAACVGSDEDNVSPDVVKIASTIARRVIIGGIDGFVGAINRTLLLSSGGLSEAI